MTNYAKPCACKICVENNKVLQRMIRQAKEDYLEFSERPPFGTLEAYITQAFRTGLRRGK